jgi:hypothetical protein
MNTIDFITKYGTVRYVQQMFVVNMMKRPPPHETEHEGVIA